MHRLYIERFSIVPCEEASQVTLGYLEHIRSALDTDYATVALASLLPCSWVYERVGRHILDIALKENNPYAEWLGEYGDEEYAGKVERMVALLDSLAEGAPDEIVTMMDKAFLRAVKYEYESGTMAIGTLDKIWKFGLIGCNDSGNLHDPCALVRFGARYIVLDSVMVATSGDRLIEESAPSSQLRNMKSATAMVP